MKVLVDLTPDEYDLLKEFAAARRKYEVGKGYRVGNAINEALSIGIESISETLIFDKNGELVNWKNAHIVNEDAFDDRPVRCIYKKSKGRD